MAAVKTDGTLWTWGYNIGGRLGTGNTDDHYSPATTAGGGTNWKQVAVSSAGTGMVGAIKNDGTLWTWGYGNNGQLGDGTTTDRSSPGTTAGGGTNWKQIGTPGAPGVSGGNACAIKTDGTLWTWGRNNNNQLGDGTTTDRSSPGTTVGGITNWKQVILRQSGNGMGGLTDLTI
jgi:alpha-tubulin suppressor-like RCC1 family protein